jgi:GNAT superfamily N-acetyltransferase
MDISIAITGEKDVHYAGHISEMYKQSAQERKIGIALRAPEYLAEKIRSGDAVIAKEGETMVGFAYIETFDGKRYVSNSGLIVATGYRGQGLGRRVKEAIFQLARSRYPNARIFGITTSDIVMKINSELGYRPVAFHQLTQDDAFWNGCSSCPNYDILMRHDRKMCLCTGMLAPSHFEAMVKDIEKFANTPKTVTTP